MNIPEEDILHRTIFNFMGKPKGMFDILVFRFNEDDAGLRAECLIWGRYVNAPEEIHEMGINKERAGQAKGKNHVYVGYISAIAKAIAQISVQGHGFALAHEPAGGLHHVGITFIPALPDKKDQHLRNSLRTLLVRCFSPLVPRP